MLEQVRTDIKARLDELLSEADKLRRALAALGTRESPTAPSASSPPKVRSRRSDSDSTPPAATSKSAHRRANATPAATAPSRQPAKPSAAKPAGGQPKTSAARAAPGATKSAILAALAGDSAMTAGEIATATGLGRATVSTTLSRLAKTGEVTKAPRGYQITKPTSAPATVDATARADS